MVKCLVHYLEIWTDSSLVHMMVQGWDRQNAPLMGMKMEIYRVYFWDIDLYF